MDTNETSQFLSNIERQQQILILLERRKRLTVTDLCDYFTISEATARRDLDLLSEQGKILRVRGGAILPRQAPPELPILQRRNEQTQEKQRIGKEAARLVRDGETIFLGSGTTVLEAAIHLRSCRRLTIITNSLAVINTLSSLPDVTLVSLGGMLRASEQSFIGHIAEKSLDEVRADKVIMGIRALSLEQGLMNEYLPETMTDRAILRIGREVIVVADHTKCGCVSTAFVAPIDHIDILVTDMGSDPSFIQALQDKGIRVILA